jgi:diguanylate cyclase (GGDEF)-like protein
VIRIGGEAQGRVSSREGIAYLTERIAQVERERDALATQAQRLEQLQRAFVEISAAIDEPEVAVAALRGAWLGLGFGRAFWFACGQAGELNALYELDEGRTGESEYGGTLPPDSSLLRVARGDSDAAMGTNGDADSPLFDVLRWYVAAKVRPRTGASFVIYADGVVDRTPSPWALSALRELADQATLTLENLRMAQELERLALHDPLTGLPNRRALSERLAIELANARRTREPVAFAIVDVDDFKRINDSRGHAGGDDALKTIAAAMRSATRETDFPARFGGDEFALVMPRTQHADAITVIQRLVDTLRAAGLPCSVGVGFADGTGTAEELLRAADTAAYVVKARGKNGFHLG